MTSTNVVKQDYNDQANSYGDYTLTPNGTLETQLLDSALGDCTGLAILDLGGGTGIRARQALDHGASFVDVVDISSEMLHIGKDTEMPPNHRERIKWHEADCSKPLDHVQIQAQETYDVVMANWMFDHAANIAQLEGMWRNIASYLKPGGRFIGVRCGDPQAHAAAQGKYGIRFKDFEKIPDGLKFRYRVETVPPLEIEASSMETSYSGSTEMHDKFGLCEVEIEPYVNTAVVKKDPEFWGLFLENPHMVVVKAKKRTV